MNFFLASVAAPTVSASPQSPAQRASVLEILWSRPALCVALLTLFGGVLRAFNLGEKSLWFDEAVLFWIAQGTPAQVVAQNASHNSAPPTYALMVGAWQTLGNSEVVLRSLSWLGGVLAIPAAYGLCAQLLPRASALFATFLVAVSSTQTLYSQELREYSWTFALGCSMLALFLHANRAPSFGAWALMVLAWSAGVFMQYGLALLVAAMNIAYLWRCLVMRKSERPGVMPFGMWLGAQFVVASAAYAVSKLSLEQHMSGGSFGAAGAANYLTLAYWDGNRATLVPWIVKRTAGILEFAAPSFLLVFPLLGVVATWRFARQTRAQEAQASGVESSQDAAQRENARWTRTLLVTSFAIGIALGMAGKYPYHGERQDMWLLPMLYVACGWAFVGALRLAHDHARWWLPPAVCVALATLGLLTTWRGLRAASPEHLRPVMQTLRDQRQANEPVFVSWGSRAAYAYYARRAGEASPSVYKLQTGREEDAARAAHERSLFDLLQSNARVWLIFSHDSPSRRREVLRRARAARPDRVRLVLKPQGQTNAQLWLADAP